MPEKETIVAIKKPLQNISDIYRVFETVSTEDLHKIAGGLLDGLDGYDAARFAELEEAATGIGWTRADVFKAAEMIARNRR
jgi:hypothetical protein